METITFKSHTVTERTVELDGNDKQEIEELTHQALLDKVEFGTFNSAYPLGSEKTVVKICKKFGVNPLIQEDRVSLFKALLGK
jgi:hypothetical protein